jgi:signal transduction histidine kinase
MRKSLTSRKDLKKDIEHITEEMYRRNRELADTNRTLSLLRTIDTLVLESHDSLSKLCSQITQVIAQTTNYSMVAILSHTLSDTDNLIPYGFSLAPSLLAVDASELLKIKLDINTSWLRGQDKTALIHIGHMPTTKVAEYLGITEEKVTSLKAMLPLQSLYIIKLITRQKLVGVMAVGFLGSIVELQHADIMLLERLSDAIGVAMDNKLLFEENQRVLKQLKKSNEKLKALDEAKDEFISMASHQLRTPLTSVKGYVSMVLEGDAGKISGQQKQLLEQAFTSSQRMVYLIADLLNVSRLKTGKFVIEAKPTSLPDVVEGEVQQLATTAKAHNLTITFNKPANFPMLNLDETKTRQVVMNFLDNAIYYTPSGGHIKVKLTSNGKTVEYKVIDNGLGVPKAEQHQLFTKFFRAANARKARPDGTGLGLYMARKVIVAQGGALIFSSTEGKGSTFGFSFPV